MVTDEKPQILNCNILFYFKWIVQTITFKLCDKTQYRQGQVNNHGLFEIAEKVRIDIKIKQGCQPSVH